MILDKLVEDIKNNNETVFTVVELTDDGFKQIDLTPAPPARYCYSISKAFTATAVGMLYSQGVWTENDLIYPIIEDIFPENHDKKWEKVTLANVLNHRSGFGRGMLSVDSDDFYEHDINKDFLYPMPVSYTHLDVYMRQKLRYLFLFPYQISIFSRLPLLF